MDRLKQWYNSTNKSNLLIAGLLLLILCLSWRLSNASTGVTSCEDCRQASPGLSAPSAPASKPGKYTVVCYYATWCGYSRQFLPEWAKFEQYVKDNLTQVTAVKIKCEGDKEAECSSKGVEGYPTVILYSAAGEGVQFNGERTAEELIEFCKRYTI